MEDNVAHKVLIVDDEAPVGKAMSRILNKMGIDVVYAGDGETGLKRISEAEKLFSIIISDQRMPGMKGHEFLEKSRKLSPDSIRILITGYSDMDAIIEAVNRGSIHRYISKPWDTGALMEIVQEGISQYEVILENEKLMRLAKDQHTKLYKLNRELKEKADIHHKMLEKLDEQIKELKRHPVSQDMSMTTDTSVEGLEKLLKKHGLIDSGSINQLYQAALSKLSGQFQELAAKKGFEMPGTQMDATDALSDRFQ